MAKGCSSFRLLKNSVAKITHNYQQKTKFLGFIGLIFTNTKTDLQDSANIKDNTNQLQFGIKNNLGPRTIQCQEQAGVKHSLAT